ncbi:hypothetical protein FXO38_03775 [Capsicum annuum]|uniref:FAR1 domain-containing protein n=1 Tax=Capsicum annuum TaxID=4072 RepID=A0A2G2YWH6_CAPAN|nr:hypothetical protein FXO38_03775 [Capsicum annuum]PHT74084.1 hypothetical protein T459_21361 [Capsicum annuum]
MDDNECNNQLRTTLHDIFGLEDSDNLHGNEDSYGGYAEGPDQYLDTDDEDLQNLADEKTNRSHQSVQDEDLSVFDDEEDHYEEDDFEEEEGQIHDDSFTKEQYMTGPIESMCFHCVKSAFAFYKEHSCSTGFGVVKKSAKKEAGQLKYGTFGCDRCRKTTARNQSKRVECKGRVNCRVMNDGSFVVTKVILEHNHELEPALSHFLSCCCESDAHVVDSQGLYHDLGLPTSDLLSIEYCSYNSRRDTTILLDS